MWTSQDFIGMTLYFIEAYFTWCGAWEEKHEYFCGKHRKVPAAIESVFSSISFHFWVKVKLQGCTLRADRTAGHRCGKQLFLSPAPDQNGLNNNGQKKQSSKITPKVISGQIGFFNYFYSFFMYSILF